MENENENENTKSPRRLKRAVTTVPTTSIFKKEIINPTKEKKLQTQCTTI